MATATDQVPPLLATVLYLPVLGLLAWLRFRKQRADNELALFLGMLGFVFVDGVLFTLVDGGGGGTQAFALLLMVAVLVAAVGLERETRRDGTS